MEIMKFVADTERSGVRIDRYLADVCPDFPDHTFRSF